MSGLKSLKKRRRVQIIVLAFVALALSTGLIGFAMRDGINLFRSPTQVLETPPGETEVFRIGGLVAIDSLVRGEGETITFVVTDGTSEVPVHYTGILPDLFDEGQGMVGQGRYVGCRTGAGGAAVGADSGRGRPRGGLPQSARYFRLIGLPSQVTSAGAVRRRRVDR